MKFIRGHGRLNCQLQSVNNSLCRSNCCRWTRAVNLEPARFIGAGVVKPKTRLCEPWVNELLRWLSPEGATEPITQDSQSLALGLTTSPASQLVVVRTFAS